MNLLRVAVSQLHELRRTVEHSRGDPAVGAFITKLSADARTSLNSFMDLGEQWLNDTMAHVRHKTNRYGDRQNRRDLRWAMRRSSDEDGDIVIDGPTLGNITLGFADTIASRHVTRLFPEWADDPECDVPDVAFSTRISELFEAIVGAIEAAQRFASEAVATYVSKLPDGVAVRRHAGVPAGGPGFLGDPDRASRPQA